MDTAKVNTLPPEFFRRDTLNVAHDIIGCYLVRQRGETRIIGRINEVEAYLGVGDKASHAYGERRTKRTAPLYEEGGIAYIHLIYGMYHCFNIVTEGKGVPQSVLLRGVEITEGFDAAAENRYGKPYQALTKPELKNLSNGPGKLCRALAIDNELNWESMQGNQLFVCSEIDSFRKHAGHIKRTKRIGVDYAEEAKDFPYRFTG